MWPFVREAVERGYVVICPEYRGSTGYGEKHYNEIDYGGYEIDDVMSANDYLKTLPHVDPERVGMMGWSHGGYITLFSVFRDQSPFKAAAAIVPVTNLIHRLSFSGPGVSAKLCDAEADRWPAVREAGTLHPAVPSLPRRQAADTPARPRRDQRSGCLVLRGPADRRCIEIAQAGSCRDEGLCRSADLGIERRSCLQPSRRSENARASRLARAGRLLESHVGVLRLASASVFRCVETVHLRRSESVGRAGRALACSLWVLSLLKRLALRRVPGTVRSLECAPRLRRPAGTLEYRRIVARHDQRRLGGQRPDPVLRLEIRRGVERLRNRRTLLEVLVQVHVV